MLKDNYAYAGFASDLFFTMEDTESTGSTEQPKIFKWTLDDNGIYNCDSDFKEKMSASK